MKIRLDYYKFVKSIIILSFLYLISKLIFTKGGDLRNIFYTFKDSSEAYIRSSIRQISTFSYLDVFFTPLTIFSISNVICNYRKIEKIYIFIAFIIIAIQIALSIGSATRSGIIEYLIILFAASQLNYFKERYLINLTQKIKIVMIAIIVISGLTIYSNYLTNSRAQLKMVVNPLTLSRPKENYILFKIFPEKLHPLINSTSFYLSHSYYRLNQAMEFPCLGVGGGLSNSFFIIDNVEQYAGWSGLKNISYGVRLDNAYSTTYGNFWSTFYTWIASDFTFPGTIPVVFIIGFLLALALKDSIVGNNPFAIASFCTLFFFIFSFAFNNPLQDGSGLVTNIGIPAAWLILRKKN